MFSILQTYGLTKYIFPAEAGVAQACRKFGVFFPVYLSDVNHVKKYLSFFIFFLVLPLKFI